MFDDLTGHIPAGRMTLVLAPPGAGKSQFLKTLGGHMRHNKLVTGELLYDGLLADEQLKGGMYTEKLCALVAQGDVHMATYTVRETMQFALDNSVVPPTAELFGQSSLDLRLLADHKRKVDLLLSVLGMHECSETIAGNDMIRGVRYGHRRAYETYESRAGARWAASCYFRIRIDLLIVCCCSVVAAVTAAAVAVALLFLPLLLLLCCFVCLCSYR